MESNYEKAKRNAQEAFLAYDQAAIAKRFCLGIDESWLSFSFLGAPCRVNRQTGLVECADPPGGLFREADFNEALTVYDLLCWSKLLAAPSGEFVNMSSLHNKNGSQAAPNPGLFFAKYRGLAGREKADLRRAFDLLGARPWDKGDLSAVIPVFDGLEMCIVIWDADDEFPAEIQFFWDKNVLYYMHYETVWYVSGAILERVERLSK